MLVNLQDSKEFSSQILNRDVWSNYNVKELVQRKFVFIQVLILVSVVMIGTNTAVGGNVNTWLHW